MKLMPLFLHGMYRQFTFNS